MIVQLSTPWPVLKYRDQLNNTGDGNYNEVCTLQAGSGRQALGFYTGKIKQLINSAIT